VIVLYQRLGSQANGNGVRATALAIAGLGLMLAGNVMEFGLVGTSPIESEDPGFFVFTLGLLATAGGLAVLALLVFRSGSPTIAQKLGLVLLPVSVVLMPLFGAAWILWSYLLWTAPAPRAT